MLLGYLQQLDLGTFQDKQKNYYLTYNASVYIFDICRFLRRSYYTSQAILYLAQAIVSMEGNLILLSVKYLEWRVKLYLELAACYQEVGGLSAAGRVIENCLKKIQECRELEEKDPPIPDFMERIFQQTRFAASVQDLKLRLQQSRIKPDEWKREIEKFDPFEQRAIAAVETLRVNNPKFFNRVEQQGK